MAKMIKAPTVDAYIKGYPSKVQAQLQKIRKTIKTAAPKAEEVISYGIPGYKYHGTLIFFAAFKNHVSVYPAPRTDDSFKKELAAYKGGKGTVQFPLDAPIPYDLVKRITQFRVKANDEAFTAKNKKTPKAASGKKSSGASDEEQMTAYLNKLDASVKKEIEAVRKIIKSASPKLKERIKWNAPSYYYKDDIVTFGPYKTHKLLLVFHHPFVVKVRSDLLQGEYKDRRLVYFKDKAEAEKNKKELARIIIEIIKMIDKK